MKKIGRVFAILTVIAVFCSTFTIFASATSVNKNLRVVCESEDAEVVGMEISIYKAASRNGNVLTLSGDFKDYNVRLVADSASVLQEAADTLANYIVTDKIQPHKTAVTDQHGNADFSNLDNGFYLVCGKKLVSGDKVYRFSPMFVEINDQSEQTTVSYGKFLVTDIQNSVVTNYTLKKIWDNEGDILEYRPDGIDVEIYLDGEFYEKVNLNKDNNWTYQWLSDETGDWNFKELNVPEQYQISIKIDGTYITVTNRLKDDTPKPSEPEEKPDPPKEDIPQTGQLWWPVPLMALLGIILIVVGVKLLAKGEKE